jgi:23S rRNA (uracil1939-C5)-methyltransferase
MPLLQIKEMDEAGQVSLTPKQKKPMFSGITNELFLSEYKPWHALEPTQLLATSPDRAPARCPSFGFCGGCQLQHLTYNSQLAQKQHSLHSLFQPFFSSTTDFMPFQSQQPFGYRKKARLSGKFVHKHQKLFLGFRQRNGRYVEALSKCPILDPDLEQPIKALAHVLNQTSITDAIPQVEAIMGDTERALIIRHLKPFTDQERALLCHYAQQHELTLYLQANKPHKLERLWPETPPRLTYTLPDYQLTLTFNPTDFIQVNQPINNAIIKQALQFLNPQKKDVIIDFFCGLGNFTLPLATKCNQVLGIEYCENMVKQATQNAQDNQLTHTQFKALDLQQPLDELKLEQPPNKVLLDPPRSGAAEVITWLTQTIKPQQIAYVSCNPQTLARDTEQLLQQGYTLTRLTGYDMFPQTKHIEALACFTATELLDP